MTSRLMLCLALLAFAIPAVPASAPAATIWDEGTLGDLSSDPENPTPLSFAPGSNLVSGSVIALSDIPDFITFTIPSGQVLSELRLVSYVDVVSGNPGNRGFHALDEGSTTVLPLFSQPTDYLGGDHVDPLPSGTDLLAALSAAPLTGTGFSVPLGPGTYSYVIQQTSTIETAYTLDFFVVPEPSILLLAASGIGLLAFRLQSGGSS